MTDKHLQPEPDLKQQTEQARRVLMRLQWLVIILLASGIVWLYFSFESVVGRVERKLALIDTVDTRLNNIDDRLFALTPSRHNTPDSTSAKHPDKELIYIQLSLANQLFRQGNFEDTLIALQAIQWQLTQNNTIATPIKNILLDSLKKDIAYVDALKNQPDAWQSHIIKIRDVQAFLRDLQSHASTPSRTDILLHDTTMLLSLAAGSASVRDRSQMTTYLQEAKGQLESYIQLNTQASPVSKPHEPHQKTTDTPAGNLPTLQTPDDALYWINHLLANTPKNKSLHSIQILQNQP